MRVLGIRSACNGECGGEDDWCGQPDISASGVKVRMRDPKFVKTFKPSTSIKVSTTNTQEMLYKYRKSLR